MFERNKEPSRLEKEVKRALDELAKESVGSKEYTTILDRVQTLHRMQQEETPAPVSKDTMLIVGANLLGILLIIKHEHLNVITSRAITMVQKLGNRP